MTQNRPYIIGLTGGIACGKTNLTSSLLAAGAVVIDADQISRAITAAGGVALPGIRATFGDDVFEGEELNRQKLARLVFFDSSALERLNAVTHPFIFLEMRRRVDQYRDRPALVLDVPLLFETGIDKCCNEIWCAFAPRNEQLARLIQRGVTREEAIRRIDSQMPATEKARLSDHVINTTGTKEESAAQAIALWQDVLRRLPLV